MKTLEPVRCRIATRAVLALLGLGIVTSTTDAAALPGQPITAAELPTRPNEILVPAHGGFLSGLPGLRFFAAEEHDRLISEEMLVRMAYSSLEHASRRSGAELRFEISDFETIYKERFDKILWSEVITLAPRTELTIQRTEVFWQDSRQGVTLEPRWEPFEAEPEVYEEFRQHFGLMSLRELLDAVGQSQGAEMGGVVAVTSYAVAVEFAGRREEYRAAFFWHADADGRVSLTVEDPVTQRVGETLVATDNFGTRAELLEAGRLAAEVRRDSSAGGGR